MYNDFEGKTVMDLGCGTGMLSAGAALLGSPAVVGVDIDADALDVALENCDQFEDPLPVDFVLADVLSIADSSACSTSGSNSSGSGGGPWRRLRCDTVIMNPPFGTRRKGADVDFLRAATRLVRGGGGAVYSLHKSSTRAHLQKVALRELGCSEAEVLAELRYDLPATYKFHKQQSRDIEVDLWRFVVPQRDEAQPSKPPGQGRAAGGDEASDGECEENSDEDDEESGE
ncbi:Methyltransferase-like protein 5 [Monoraphidium neglectum]|uniref:Methyltransferase-like protein 5 n=1 Tax=Monoraphidium neglectum TaxID=145388 RepID=A0A0D2LXD1_9CHLO|nr:Methyltransferase-like protein 5 [Monoraphidium neglectum]KIY96084.1 Methyltransferase-like protein 5 [Monoraphidium neglectum]|eukprot:XP_013895104.1 Methyltransferase-like protein 5 [Monoraphidium neglectum]